VATDIGDHRPVRVPEFALERFFARWEFAVRHLLCASDVEAWPMSELLALADDETVALWTDLRLGYTESTGHPLLRAEIAGLYDTIGPDDVLVFAGAEEAIFCLSNVLLGPGVTNPYSRHAALIDEPDAQLRLGPGSERRGLRPPAGRGEGEGASERALRPAPRRVV